MRLKTQKSSFDIKIPVSKGETAPILTIEPLSSSEIMALLKKHKEVTYEEGSRHEEYNDLELRKERFSLMVTNWSGFEKEDGSALECNKANKDGLCEHDSEFVGTIFDLIEKAQEAELKAKAKAQKN